MPTDLPPRFLVSAASYALESGTEPQEMSHQLVHYLASLNRQPIRAPAALPMRPADIAA
jgi:hypothetical protein